MMLEGVSVSLFTVVSQSQGGCCHETGCPHPRREKKRNNYTSHLCLLFLGRANLSHKPSRIPLKRPQPELYNFLSSLEARSCDVNVSLGALPQGTKPGFYQQEEEGTGY